MIEGVGIYPLKQIPDDRGRVMHMLRADDPHFEKFGEIYFSTVYPGVVKGWHWHKRMIINYAVVVGMIKFVLYDERENSPTRGQFQEIYMGENNYVLVKVPTGIWNGVKGLGVTPSIIANCATIVHDPDEMMRMDPHHGRIQYDWSLKDR